MQATEASMKKTTTIEITALEALVSEWEDKAKAYESPFLRCGPLQRERIAAIADALWQCSRQLRRRMESPDEYAAGENVEMSREVSEAQEARNEPPES